MYKVKLEVFGQFVASNPKPIRMFPISTELETIDRIAKDTLRNKIILAFLSKVGTYTTGS